MKVYLIILCLLAAGMLAANVGHSKKPEPEANFPGGKIREFLDPHTLWSMLKNFLFT